MRWLLDHAPAVAEAGARLAFGTIESWLMWKLTGGQHVSDASNASRTQLMALDGTDWDIGLCDLFGVPPQALPEIVDNIGALGATQAEWGSEERLCGKEWVGRCESRGSP